MSKSSLCALWLGLCVGNFAYQSLFGDGNYFAAADRSFFQFGALLMVAIYQWSLA